MNRSYREPIESDFIVSVTENDNVSELEDNCSLEPIEEVIEEPVVKVIEEPVVKVIEEPVVKVIEEPVVKVIEEPVVKVIENTQLFAEPTVELLENIFENTETNQKISEHVNNICDEVIPKKAVVFSETIIEKFAKNPTENNETMATEVDKYVNALDPALSKFAGYLTPQEFIVIQTFVNEANSVVISQIKQCIQNIMSEKVIQLHDIPNFVLSISQILTSNIVAIQNINVINIIKYTLDSLMEYNVLDLKGEKNISKSLIETSFKLLKTSILKNKSKKLFSSLFSCFK